MTLVGGWGHIQLAQLHIIPSVDIAAFSGKSNNPQILSVIAHFAKTHGFLYDQGSLPGSPDYAIRESPVILVSNTHDGLLSVALVRLETDKKNYDRLARELTQDMTRIGFKAVVRSLAPMEDETN